MKRSTSPEIALEKKNINLFHLKPVLPFLTVLQRKSNHDLLYFNNKFYNNKLSALARWRLAWIINTRLSAYWQWKLANERARARISAGIVKYHFGLLIWVLNFALDPYRRIPTSNPSTISTFLYKLSHTKLYKPTVQKQSYSLHFNKPYKNIKLILLCNQALPGIEAWTARKLSRLHRILWHQC